MSDWKLLQSAFWVVVRDRFSPVRSCRDGSTILVNGMHEGFTSISGYVCNGLFSIGEDGFRTRRMTQAGWCSSSVAGSRRSCLWFKGRSSMPLQWPANFGLSVLDGYRHVVVLVSLIATSNARSPLTSQYLIGFLSLFWWGAGSCVQVWAPIRDCGGGSLFCTSAPLRYVQRRGLGFGVGVCSAAEELLLRFSMVRRVWVLFFSSGCVLVGPIATAAGCGVEHAGWLVLELSGLLAANFGLSVLDGYGHVVVLVSLIATSNARFGLRLGIAEVAAYFARFGVVYRPFPGLIIARFGCCG
ncbi:hypothetical protein F2Q70_00036947 [Brassica cretica]|uniref:Uncharacterized protein n=1 Tax=Brassica cretica TaxID=69181 RepID=A0A8S9JU29_BRACR|nr:hypothetical protein F2Q70_00036947 [Brassica cretica]